jgi:hypothetical protein
VDRDAILKNPTISTTSYDTLAMLDLKKASMGIDTIATGSTAINSKKASLEPQQK